MSSSTTNESSNAHDMNTSKRMRTVLFTCFAVLAAIFYLFLDRDGPEMTSRFFLCDFYITVAEDSDVTELTMYTGSGASPPNSNTAKRIEIDGKKYFHFAVSYHPETIYTLGGSGVVSYEITEFDERTVSMDLYLDGADKISFCGKKELG